MNVCGQRLLDEKELLRGSIEEYYARLATWVRLQQKQGNEQQDGNT
jgi:hypothetical protein